MKPDIPEDLKKTLEEIDGRGYKSYKCLQGKSYDFSPFRMKFEHVQGDAFAPPSRISVTIELATAGFADASLYDSSTRVLAFEDYLLRSVHRHVKSLDSHVEATRQT